MRRPPSAKLVVFLVAAAVACTAFVGARALRAASRPAAPLRITSDGGSVADLGVVEEPARIEHAFRIENTGSTTLPLDRIERSCTCSQVVLEREELAPGETATVRVVADVRGRTGLFSAKVWIGSSQDPTRDLHRLELTASLGRVGSFRLESAVVHLAALANPTTMDQSHMSARPTIRDDASQVFEGEVVLAAEGFRGSPAPVLDVAISNASAAPFELEALDVERALAGDVETTRTRVRVRCTIASDDPLERVVALTGRSGEHVFEDRLVCRVQPSRVLVVAPKRSWCGSVAPGSSVTREIVVTSATGAGLARLEVEAPPWVRARVDDAAEGAVARRVQLEIEPEADGLFEGEVVVRAGAAWARATVSGVRSAGELSRGVPR